MFRALRCLAERVIPSSPGTAIPFSANLKVSGRVTAFNSRPCGGPLSTSSNQLKLSSQTRHALWNRAAFGNSRLSVAIRFILSVLPLIDSSCTPFPRAQACHRNAAVQNCTALSLPFQHTYADMKHGTRGRKAAAVKTAKARSSKAAADPYLADLFETIAEGKTVLQLGKNEKVFAQGDTAEAIYFIQTGKVKITVVSAVGTEAVLTVLGPHDFFGEGCLVGQTVRVSSAIAIQSSILYRIERRSMLRSLHGQSELSEKFTASLLARNIELEEDLCDQLFNHSEKRLARVLLKLARFGLRDVLPAAKMPRMSHETLAEMVGTTRSRVTHFMNKFRKLGLIDYKGNEEIVVRAELLTDVVLHD